MKRADVIASIGASDIELVDSALRNFLRETNARCVVVVDRTGRLLTTVGDTGGFDEITFASLAAADFAASDQLAVLLGEQEFSTLYHHNTRQSMYLADVGGLVILAALFGRKSTLGLVRLRTGRVVAQLSSLFREIADRGPSGPVVQMEVGWAQEVESEIDRLFTE
ncbi:MAG: roadblock/LC7 domain-containing protein [Gemmatimonadetes bacterium]|nr:roadblock/LC7 domain-containing protein [Gemmatimonadota bacterium]